MARDLAAFVVPGLDVARAQGLDLRAAGLRIVASPRHASVLLVAGDLPPTLRTAASVIYAQMMRPRALLLLGSANQPPLPTADVTGALSQPGLVRAVDQLRRAFGEGAFRADISDFDAPALQARIDYTCPMHPEIISDTPGSCPKCGMDLVPREMQATVDHPMHGTAKPDTDMHDPEKGPQSHGAHAHAQHPATDAAQYTCPMHPEVIGDEPGDCPKCGMHLVPVADKDEERESHQPGGHGEMDHAKMDHSKMDHGKMDHGGAHFMSMVDVTKDLPRSSDGLQMDWTPAAFGPFFPGLPGGLMLNLTLDGDTVAATETCALPEQAELLSSPRMGPIEFSARLAGLVPLAPVSYRLLACRAMENAAGVAVSESTAKGRIGALERERIASHLGWLALTGLQTGFAWLNDRAAALQLQVQRADVAALATLTPTIKRLAGRLRRTPLQRARLAGIGQLPTTANISGPVARGSGHRKDARSDDRTSLALGFAPICRDGGDALARMQVRLDEMTQSLALIAAAGAIVLPEPDGIAATSGQGAATVETPRGAVRLEVTLDQGQVVAARIAAPSHLALAATLADQQELGDALAAINSLDLCPWEARL